MNLTSPEGATALLPAWVLSTESLGEVLGIANRVLAEKSIKVGVTQCFELNNCKFKQ